MNKNVFALLTSSVIAVTAIAASPLKSQALTFDFQFNQFNNTVTPPIVGTGTFSFNGDPGNGTFALTSLPNYNFSFNFNNGSSFTNTDIRTPLANVLVRIQDNGSRFVNFGGSGGGPFRGSLDFTNASGGLSFQPNFGTLYFTTRGAFGTYQGIVPADVTPVPEPGSIVGLLGLSLGALMANNKRKVNQA